MAERAQLFSEGLGVLTHDSFSPDSDGEDAEGLLRDQCQEMRTQINQVGVGCSVADKRRKGKDIQKVDQSESWSGTYAEIETSWHKIQLIRWPHLVPKQKVTVKDHSSLGARPTLYLVTMNSGGEAKITHAIWNFLWRPSCVLHR